MRNSEVEKKADVLQTHTKLTACGRVLMLRPANHTTAYAPLTVTCGKKQAKTSTESTTFDTSCQTFLFIHLMIALDHQKYERI